MRYLINLIILCSLLFTCSCQPASDALAKGVAEETTKHLVAKLLNESKILLLSLQAYYLENDRWPSNQEELFLFCYNNDWEFAGQYWETCKEVEIIVSNHGSIEMTYARIREDPNGSPVTIPGTIEGPKLEGNIKDICQEMDALIKEKNKLDQLIQIE